MKEVLIIIFIIFIVFAGNLYINKYIEKTSDSLINDLQELRNRIKNNSITQDELKNKANEVYGNWKNISKTWSNIVLHDEIDSIETALIRAKTKIEIGDIKESLEDLETSIFLVNHIKEKEKISIKNIF